MILPVARAVGSEKRTAGRGGDRAIASEILASLPGRHASIFLQPFQFFSHFDLSMPWVFREGVALAGKDQQLVRNAERIERVL